MCSSLIKIRQVFLIVVHIPGMVNIGQMKKRQNITFRSLRCRGNYKKYLSDLDQTLPHTAGPFVYMSCKIRKRLIQNCWNISQKRLSYTQHETGNSMHER